MYIGDAAAEGAEDGYRACEKGSARRMEKTADEQLHDLHCSRRMGVTCSTYGNMREKYRVLVGKPEGDQLEDLGVEGRMLLVSILNRWRSRGLD